MKVLRNPLLFSIYASTVAPNDLPLRGSGEVSAFSVISQFWHTTVQKGSLGQRVPRGYAGCSAAIKREAVKYVVSQTLSGNDVIDRASLTPVVDAGIDNLVREGVLLTQGTHAVRWRHAWLKEYGIVDYLLAQIGAPSPIRLAEAICKVKNNSAATAAATGAAKWISADSQWGPLEDYLERIYALNSGLAREALSVIIEGTEHALRLSKLSNDLLIEAIEFAIQLKARQWVSQIECLADERFRGITGRRLLNAVAAYETSEFANE